MLAHAIQLRTDNDGQLDRVVKDLLDLGLAWLREAGAETALATEAVNRLAALRLVRRLEHGVQALPALHRYAIAEALHD